MRKPHVLVTNDDGINSFFLRLLVIALLNEYEVTVVAPMKEQSWIGRAISRDRELRMTQVETFPCKAYALDGTPSDCVNIALDHLLKNKSPVAVCSGINIGFNTGSPILWSSGTFAGAIEGAGWGFPALSFSHDLPDSEFLVLRDKHGHAQGKRLESLNCAANIAVQFVQQVIAKKNPPFVVHNINFPIQTKMDSIVEITHPMPDRLVGLFKQESPGSFRFVYPAKNFLYRDEAYDFFCLKRGNISHSIIKTNS